MHPSSNAAQPAANEDLFPGLAEYLQERFGPEASAATWQRLSTPAQEVKEGGYGIPYLVSWTGPEAAA